MTTNEERREVARRMRDMRLNPWDDAACEIASCAGIVCCNSECHGSDETPECMMALVSRLADLIDPEPERTCRLVDCHAYDTCVVNRELGNGNIMSMEFGYKQCSECGAYVFDCPTVRYCPNCGAKVVGE